MEGKFEIILWLELAHVKKQIREFFRLLSLQLDIQNKVTTASQETIEPVEQPPNNPTSSTINLFNANQLDPSNDTQTLNTQLIQINTDLEISRRNLNKEFDLFIKHFNLTSTFESPFDYINQPLSDTAPLSSFEPLKSVYEYKESLQLSSQANIGGTFSAVGGYLSTFSPLKDSHTKSTVALDYLQSIDTPITKIIAITALGLDSTLSGCSDKFNLIDFVEKNHDDVDIQIKMRAAYSAFQVHLHGKRIVANASGPLFVKDVIAQSRKKIHLDNSMISLWFNVSSEIANVYSFTHSKKPPIINDSSYYSQITYATILKYLDHNDFYATQVYNEETFNKFISSRLPEDIFSIVRVINYDIILPIIKLLFLNPISSHRDHKLKNSYHFLWLCLKPSGRRKVIQILINTICHVCSIPYYLSNKLFVAANDAIHALSNKPLPFHINGAHVPQIDTLALANSKLNVYDPSLNLKSFKEKEALIQNAKKQVKKMRQAIIDAKNFRTELNDLFHAIPNECLAGFIPAYNEMYPLAMKNESDTALNALKSIFLENSAGTYSNLAKFFAKFFSTAQSPDQYSEGELLLFHIVQRTLEIYFKENPVESTFIEEYARRISASIKDHLQKFLEQPEASTQNFFFFHDLIIKALQTPLTSLFSSLLIKDMLAHIVKKEFINHDEFQRLYFKETISANTLKHTINTIHELLNIFIKSHLADQNLTTIIEISQDKPLSIFSFLQRIQVTLYILQKNQQNLDQEHVAIINDLAILLAFTDSFIISNDREIALDATQHRLEKRSKLENVIYYLTKAHIGFFTAISVLIICLLFTLHVINTFILSLCTICFIFGLWQIFTLHFENYLRMDNRDLIERLEPPSKNIHPVESNNIFRFVLEQLHVDTDGINVIIGVFAKWLSALYSVSLGLSIAFPVWACTLGVFNYAMLLIPLTISIILLVAHPEFEKWISKYDESYSFSGLSDMVLWGQNISSSLFLPSEKLDETDELEQNPNGFYH